MKWMRVVNVLCLLVVLCLPAVGAAEEKQLTATGEAAATGDREAYRKLALDRAFRQAVEQEVGVWIKATSEVRNNELVKDEILTKAAGYVLAHEIIKEDEKGGKYTVMVNVTVSSDRIGEDFKKLVAKAKRAVGNPSVTFVLTTWESRGKKTTVSGSQSVDASAAAQSRTGTDRADASLAGKASQQLSVERIDETLWKKYPDATIIDAFQQEFKDKGFDLKAADRAREIALTESLAATAVNPSDRKAVRAVAQKEGANFVARGEARLIDSRLSDATGTYDVTAQVGVEIIDVNSGDIVASYSNTATASSKSEPNARVQAVKKTAVLGARTLAEQTVATWQERAETGRTYTIEVRNITSIRKQQKAFLDALETIAQITNQTSPKEGVLLVDVRFKGEKRKLGDALLDQLGSKPGFSEKEFDGPFDEGGTIVFKFKKK